MIRAAYTLGVTHPPGYPLYTLIGRLFCLIPVGDIAFRINLLSAAAVSLACALIGRSVCRIISSRPGFDEPLLLRRSAAWWSGLFGALALGVGPAVWWQALIAEKYGLNLLFNALVFTGILAGLMRRDRSLKCAAVVGLLYGISASHHGQTVYFLPAAGIFLVLALSEIKPDRRGRAFALFGFMVVLALSVKFLYPPVRAAQDPVHNWIDPSNLARYIFYQTGGPYHYRIMYWDIPTVLARLRLQAAAFFPEQLSWPGIFLALVGFIWLARNLGGAALAAAAAFGTGVVYCVNFMLTGEAIRTYYMPVFMVAAAFLGVGLGLFLRRARRAGLVWSRLALVAAAAWVAWMALDNRRGADRSRHYFAYDYSGALLASVPERCILVTYEDRDLFPLWYQQDILGAKPGVILVVANLRGESGLPDAPERAAETELVFPGKDRFMEKKLPLVASLRRVSVGMPVYFTVVNGMIEDYPLLPRGAAYRLIRGNINVETDEIVGEWRRFKRWRRVRGIFDAGVPKDQSTTVPISYYAYSDYRRGYLLASLGDCREAATMFRAALAWPYFKWLGPAATRVALGGCLLELGDDAGAEKQYIEAIRAAPAWLPGLRTLGAFYVRQGRDLEAWEIFRRIIELAPDDLQARRDLENFAPPRPDDPN